MLPPRLIGSLSKALSSSTPFQVCIGAAFVCQIFIKKDIRCLTFVRKIFTIMITLHDISPDTTEQIF